MTLHYLFDLQKNSKGKRTPLLYFAVVILLQIAFVADADPLRRPLSPPPPLFLLQVRQPDSSDPQASINVIPADVPPYTVFIYCMVARTGTQTNGYAFADCFCNVAQKSGIWCMFQCASGYANALNNLSATDWVVSAEDFDASKIG